MKKKKRRKHKKIFRVEFNNCLQMSCFIEEEKSLREVVKKIEDEFTNYEFECHGDGMLFFNKKD